MSTLAQSFTTPAARRAYLERVRGLRHLAQTRERLKAAEERLQRLEREGGTVDQLRCVYDMIKGMELEVAVLNEKWKPLFTRKT